jgi:hypothetical protein
MQSIIKLAANQERENLQGSPPTAYPEMQISIENDITALKSNNNPISTDFQID